MLVVIDIEESSYLIIGGGLSSLYAAQAIRERDSTGTLTLVTEEQHLPYDRVPLSKGYLAGKVHQESLFPRKTAFFEERKIRVITGRRVVKLSPLMKRVALDDGTVLGFDRLLLSTGGRPRKLTIPGSDLAGIHYLRTLDDCNQIKMDISHARSAVIIGGGFIGCELAAAFSSKGLDTTIVEAFPSILTQAFDPSTAKWIEGYFVSKGVKIVVSSPVAEFVGADGRVTGIMTKDGMTISGDMVVVGVGIVPNVELAQQAGLAVENGIVVDEFLRTSHPDIFAAGDVARLYHPVFGHHLRVEHYDMAVKEGRLAGMNMAGGKEPFTEMPYFFSYMFDLTTKAYGDMSNHDATVTRGVLGRGGFFQFFFTQGRLAAFLSMNSPMDEIQAARSILSYRPTQGAVNQIGDLKVELQVIAASLRQVSVS